MPDSQSAAPPEAILKDALKEWSGNIPAQSAAPERERPTVPFSVYGEAMKTVASLQSEVRRLESELAASRTEILRLGDYIREYQKVQAELSAELAASRLDTRRMDELERLRQGGAISADSHNVFIYGEWYCSFREAADASLVSRPDTPTGETK